MGNSKNYYMEEKIGNDGIAKTRNPIYQSKDYQPFQISPRNINIGEHFTSDSKYDETLGDVTGAIEEGLTVDDLRARQQSGWEMAGNAIVNNLAIAGTTAVGGIIGLVEGLFESAYEGNINKIWDNSVNNKMVEWQDAVREALPVYRGVEYQNKSLLGKMGTGIFWADLFQNLGYTEGMLIPGMGVAGLLSRAPSIVARTVPSLVSAIGEASNEAIRGKNDEINNKTKIANKEYNEIAANAKSPFALGVLDSKYQQTLRDIESDANKAGNFIFGSNIALLTLSNTIQFGNLFSRGFGTSKRLKGALKRAGNTYSADNMALSMATTGGKKVLDAFSEGMEEVSQSAISNTPMNYTNYNTFNESMFNPDKRELVSNLWTAFGKSYSDTLKDSDTAVEFMSGFLIGALGVPTLRRSKFPITLENNIGVELYDTYKQVQESKRLADEINSRLQSDKKINSYYNGLVRHLAIQDRMNSALDADDAYDYKTAESAQFISDIMMFDDAGDIDYLKDIINNSVDMSDEGIATIIKETSKNGEGPFMYNGNPMDTQSVRTLLQERIQTLNSKIDNYLKDRQTLEQNYPNMDKETLSNSLFLKQQYRDHSNRYDLLADELYSGINKLLQTIPEEDSQVNKHIQKGEAIYIKSPNGKKKLVRKSSIDYFDENGNPVFKDSETTASTESPKFLSKAAMLFSLQFNPETRQFIEEVLDSDTPTMPFDEKQELKAKLTDLYKLSENLKNINKALKDITTDMSKSKKDLDNIKDKKVEEDNTRKGASLKDKLASITDLAEFRSALAEESDDNIRSKVLKELEEEGNVTAKNYKEITSYNNDVQRAINSLDESPTVKADALKLLQDQFENSSNLNEIANPNSIYIDNADALYDDNLTPEENAVKFQEAQYALLRAMNQINNENRFKNRFSQDYRTLREKGKPNPSAPTKDTTGDSGTSTIPSVSTESLPVVTYEPPVGNVTATQVKDENRETNSSVETPQSLDNNQRGRRPYYRPSIPELHIQASKEGDFRPFNVVAAEREKGVNFDELYNYLRDNGAFTYVNEGNLKVGDELGFIIDPEFNNKTIFIVDRKNNQIVGSLDEYDYSVDRYEGLAGLEERIKAEFAQKDDKSKKFIATPTTRVSKVMVGRIPYSTEERSLANIPNVSGEGRAPIFGIIKNGILTTNGKIDDSLIIKPVDMSQKEGRMYLLIPNAAGKYSPAAVRVKHFNKTEFNPKDVEVQSTQVYKNIQESIDTLTNSLSEDDLNNAVKSLSTNLYTGDLHIDWFTSNAGNGIRFTKVQRDAQGNEIYEEKDGKRVRKEEVYTVFISSGVASDPNYRGSLGVEEGDPLLETKDIDIIKKNITEILLNMNLPIQVNLGMLNRGGYNNILINSNVLTSNISDARVISSWFTTDYFDVEGNLHKAVNPASVTPDTTRKVETPVGGTEGVIIGTKVVVDGVTYGVDLTTGVIYGSNNQRVYPKNAQLISDLAWASANFGDATNGSFIWNNKILLPSGQVLDRATQKYLTGKEAQEVKDKIAGRERTIGDSKKVIAQIDENQKKVDKTRTDGEFYYILEEDGQYHEYERVHSRLGSNWVESKKQTDALKNIRVRLSQLADNVTQYNDYLKYLSNYWKVNLDAFSGKIDARSRDTIVNIIRDSMSGTNSQVDSVVRNFFTSNDTPVKPNNMSEKAFTDLITSLTEIKSNIEARGERFLTNNIVLFQKYSDGTRIAGEVDILSVDADGNFRIYDVETNKYSFYDFTDKYGNRVNYFLNPSATQRMSAKDYYTLQLSAYKNLFESQYHTPITTLAIMPFVFNYNKDVIDGVTKEKGIMITYNPSVNVPLVGAVKVSEPASTNSSIPIFNSALEIQDPINRILPENDFAKNSIVGYYDKGGKLYKGYLKHIGTIEGVDIYLTKERDRGFGKGGELNKSSSYYVVLPNGKLVDTKTLSKSDDEAASVIMEALQAKPQKVKDLASEKTLIFDPTSAPKVEVPKVETPATILSTSTESGAAKTAQAEQAVNNKKASRVRHTLLRRVDNETFNTWNQEKELAWIKKVLPQLSDNDRVRVVKGLIRVANSGAYAWGQFNNGIITLSDVAAEGTAYHEAFHAVFNLLLDQNERTSLLNEYREKHPNMDNLSLEEELAEDFREFVIQGGKDTRSLGRKIIDFFKSLFIKTKYWKDFRPSSIYYFRAINEGKYSREDIPITTLGDSRYKQEEYTQEMKDILAKAPRDSQGRLLAPNRKPSNLTERQYAQVRTKAFKEWFGNWEKVAYSSKFRESLDIPNSITSATYQGITVGEALFDPDMAPDGGTRIIFLGDKYIGEIPVFETKDEIIMGGSIGAATEIEKEYRGKGYGKKAHLALANIAKSEGKILYSDSSNSDAEDALWKSLVRDGIAEVISERPKVGHWNHITYRILNDKLPQADDINSGDRNVSKVVDENGEPLVVYHGSNNKFTTFSYDYFGRHDSGSLGKAFYFSHKNVAEAYAEEAVDNYEGEKTLYPVFLNIRNIATDEIDNETPINFDNPLFKDYDGAFVWGWQYAVRNPNQIKSATDNIGAFDANNPDIRYRKVPSIAELRAQEKSAYDRFNNDIEEYYREARDIIKEVNYRRFNTEREAMKAFNESGIRKDFFYRITREGANNAAGYKIQLLTRDMVEQYKQDNNPYSDEYKDYTTPIENFYFDSLGPEIQMMLFDKGWTKEQFDSISQQERDQAVKCIAL